MMKRSTTSNTDKKSLSDNTEEESLSDNNKIKEKGWSNNSVLPGDISPSLLLGNTRLEREKDERHSPRTSYAASSSGGGARRTWSYYPPLLQDHTHQGSSIYHRRRASSENAGTKMQSSEQKEQTKEQGEDNTPTQTNRFSPLSAAKQQTFFDFYQQKHTEQSYEQNTHHDTGEKVRSIHQFNNNTSTSSMSTTTKEKRFSHSDHRQQEDSNAISTRATTRTNSVQNDSIGGEVQQRRHSRGSHQEEVQTAIANRDHSTSRARIDAKEDDEGSRESTPGNIAGMSNFSYQQKSILNNHSHNGYSNVFSSHDNWQDLGNRGGATEKVIETDFNPHQEQSSLSKKRQKIGEYVNEQAKNTQSPLSIKQQEEQEVSFGNNKHEEGRDHTNHSFSSSPFYNTSGLLPTSSISTNPYREPHQQQQMRTVGEELMLLQNSLNSQNEQLLSNSLTSFLAAASSSSRPAGAPYDSLGGGEPAAVNHSSMINTTPRQYNQLSHRAASSFNKSLPPSQLCYPPYEQNASRGFGSSINPNFNSFLPSSSLQNHHQDTPSNFRMSTSQQLFLDNQHHQQEYFDANVPHSMYPPPPLTLSQSEQNYRSFYGDSLGISQSLLFNSQQEKTIDKPTKLKETARTIKEDVSAARDPKAQDEIRKRPFMCLGIDEDQQRLSNFLCFLRRDCIEVFRAQPIDVYVRRRSKKIVQDQVGIRCRFCAHLSPSERLGRSSSFPSSIDRIYQSVTMMIREHFSQCGEMLPEIRDKYSVYRNMTKKGDILESKSYWVESAKSLGMYDSDQGIKIRGSLSMSNLSEQKSNDDNENDGNDFEAGAPHSNAAQL